MWRMTRTARREQRRGRRAREPQGGRARDRGTGDHEVDFFSLTRAPLTPHPPPPARRSSTLVVRDLDEPVGCRGTAEVRDSESYGQELGRRGHGASAGTGRSSGSLVYCTGTILRSNCFYLPPTATTAKKAALCNVYERNMCAPAVRNSGLGHIILVVVSGVPLFLGSMAVVLLEKAKGMAQA